LALRFNYLSGFLVPPYAGEFSAMIVRTRNGENLLQAHRKHIYQLLSNEKGIPHWEVSVGYGAFQTLVGVSVLAVKPLGATAVILLLAAYSVGFFEFGHLVRRSVLSD
jgi:hypothetical protein